MPTRIEHSSNNEIIGPVLGTVQLLMPLFLAEMNSRQ